LGRDALVSKRHTRIKKHVIDSEDLSKGRSINSVTYCYTSLPTDDGVFTKLLEPRVARDRGQADADPGQRTACRTRSTPEQTPSAHRRLRLRQRRAAVATPAPRRSTDVRPHRINRRKPATQDGRALRRYRRPWIVERTFSWLGNFRRFVVHYERSFASTTPSFSLLAWLLH
jgi:hypothetical protein